MAMASASFACLHWRSGLSNHRGNLCPPSAAQLSARRVNRLGAAGPMVLSVNCSSTKEEPLALRAAVSAATELLRVFNKDSVQNQSEAVNESTIASENVVGALRSDYAESYFLTGGCFPLPQGYTPQGLTRMLWCNQVKKTARAKMGHLLAAEKFSIKIFSGNCRNAGDFTDALYAENCFFADPTVQFSGRDLYKRNLKLLVPFYEDPSLVLDDIQEVGDGESKFVRAFWRLRVYLKLPWKPFIAVDGSTKYEFDANAKQMFSKSPLTLVTDDVGSLFRHMHYTLAQ